MIISNQDSFGIVVRFISFKNLLLSFWGLKRLTKIHLLIEEEQQQPKLTQKTSADEQEKPDLEADNKQLRELVTSLHQKQQTTSLEVICNC